MTRRLPKHDYRHFPPAYFDHLRRFGAFGDLKIGPLSPQDAQSIRYDLYTFRSKLREAIPTGDPIARELGDIAAQMILRIIPAEDGQQRWLVMQRHPIYTAGVVPLAEGDAT